MKHEDSLLTPEEVLSEGINFDLLSYDADMEHVLDDFEACGGKPFSGLTYELTRTRRIAWYGRYKDGVPDGERIDFMPDGSVRERSWFVHGKRVTGDLSTDIIK